MWKKKNSLLSLFLLNDHTYWTYSLRGSDPPAWFAAHRTAKIRQLILSGELEDSGLGQSVTTNKISIVKITDRVLPRANFLLFACYEKSHVDETSRRRNVANVPYVEREIWILVNRPSQELQVFLMKDGKNRVRTPPEVVWGCRVFRHYLLPNHVHKDIHSFLLNRKGFIVCETLWNIVMGWVKFFTQYDFFYWTVMLVTWKKKIH